jgi:hypothetical protein
MTGSKYGFGHRDIYFSQNLFFFLLMSIVEEPHHFYAAPAPAPTLLYDKAEFLKRVKLKHMLKLYFLFDSV